MKILLDTCTFIWMVTGEAVPEEVALALRNPDNDVLLSAASAWEISLTHALGHLELAKDPASFVREGRKRHDVVALSIDEEAVLHSARLPPLHKDPFDRLLVSQAIVQGCAIATPDRLIQQYAIRILW